MNIIPINPIRIKIDNWRINIFEWVFMLCRHNRHCRLFTREEKRNRGKISEKKKKEKENSSVSYSYNLNLLWMVNTPCIFFLLLLLFFSLLKKSFIFLANKKNSFSRFLEPDTPGRENYDDSETDGSIISETDTRTTFNVYKIKSFS